MELGNEFRAGVPADADPVDAVPEQGEAVDVGPARRVQGPQVEPIDVLPIVARSVVKRLLPVVSAIGLVVVVRKWRRRHR
jgi:hypothetical protein